MAGRRAGLSPRDLTPSPGTPEVDRLTWTVVLRPCLLEVVQHMLRAVSRPDRQKAVVAVLEAAAATHRDEPRIPDLGEDHQVALLALVPTEAKQDWPPTTSYPPSSQRVLQNAAINARNNGPAIAGSCLRIEFDESWRGGEEHMAGPFILIATNRLKPGKLDAERARVPGLMEFIETAEPRVLAFNEYANEEGTEVAVVQVHPDTDSFEFHMEAVRERASKAYEETLDATTGIEVFGDPTPRIMAMLRQAAGAGVQYRIKVHHLGGFTRKGAAALGIG
jgi:hypothetical protein